jgi:aspartate/tyrosine/aromatic aminotransferase
MTKEFHIYLLPSGRINVSGIAEARIDYLARAMHESIQRFPAPEALSKY